MKCEHVQIMLVSEQAAANLTAALDETMGVTHAVLLVTAKMQVRANALERVLKETGRTVSVVTLKNEKDFDDIQNTVIDLADEHDGKSVSVNLTGGTKLMALAVQNTILLQPERQWRPFYVDIDTDTIIWLEPKADAQALTHTPRLAHYLNSYGFAVEKRPVPPLVRQRENFLDDLVHNVSSLEKPIGQLNWCIQEAAKDAVKIDLDNRLADDPNLNVLLDKLETAGLIRRTSNGIQFTSHDAKRFCHGGWLEAHVYRVVEQLSGPIGIRDKALNPEVTAFNGTKNELDVVFLLANRLHVVECKTSRLDQDTKANDVLFKLAENCRRVGGIGTRGMLATYRQLRPAEKQLANALGIECVAGAELKRLPEKLKNWTQR